MMVRYNKENNSEKASMPIDQGRYVCALPIQILDLKDCLEQS